MSLTVDITDESLLDAIRNLNSLQQIDLITFILSDLGPDAYQAADQYLKDNPCNVRVCLRCRGLQFYHVNKDGQTCCHGPLCGGRPQ